MKYLITHIYHRVKPNLGVKLQSPNGSVMGKGPAEFVMKWDEIRTTNIHVSTYGSMGLASANLLKILGKSSPAYFPKWW